MRRIDSVRRLVVLVHLCVWSAVTGQPTACSAAEEVEVDSLLDGRWEVMSFISGGHAIEPTDLFNVRISRSRFVGTFPGRQRPVIEFAFLRNDFVSPGHINLVGTLPADLFFHGVYEREDDVLRICFRDIRGERPLDFQTEKGDEKTLLVLKRATGPAAEGVWDLTVEDMERAVNVADELRKQGITHTLVRPLGFMVVQFKKGEANSQTLALLKPCNLQMWLVLRNAQLSPAALDALSVLDSLIELDLGSADLKDDDFTFLRNLPRLTALDIGDTHVTDAGLVHFGKLLQLSSLDLNNTSVRGHGLVHLQNCRELHDIKLDYTKLEDVGLKHLSKLPKLRFVSLAKTNVTDEGIMHFARSVQLESLYVPHTKVTPEGAEKLKDAVRAAKAKAHAAGEEVVMVELSVRLHE